MQRSELAGRSVPARLYTAVGGNRHLFLLKARSESHYTPHCLALQARFRVTFLIRPLFSSESKVSTRVGSVFFLGSFKPVHVSAPACPP